MQRQTEALERVGEARVTRKMKATKKMIVTMNGGKWRMLFVSTGKQINQCLSIPPLLLLPLYADAPEVDPEVANGGNGADDNGSNNPEENGTK
jgi:hypothetical protein